MVGAETTVLIVDDDPVTVDRFGSWLNEAYEVRTALDGETALTAADEADVVLVDRRLPDRSGREVASRILERDDRPVVAMVSVRIRSPACGNSRAATSAMPTATPA